MGSLGGSSAAVRIAGVEHLRFDVSAQLVRLLFTREALSFSDALPRCPLRCHIPQCADRVKLVATPTLKTSRFPTSHR